jgi:gliding motility-associated-like protein
MNSFLVATRTALLFVAFFGCITGHAQVDLTRGLVGCYPFSGNAKDSIFEWVVDGTKQDASSASLQIPTKDKGADYQINVSVKVDFDRSCFEQPEPFEIAKTLDVKHCTNPLEGTSKLLIPDIFTPNGDGKNDSWEILNVEKPEDLGVRIFSRWGEIIYHSNEYSHPWNGTYRGKLVPSGNYPYQIFLEGKLLKSGSVMVVY